MRYIRIVKCKVLLGGCGGAAGLPEGRRKKLKLASLKNVILVFLERELQERNIGIEDLPFVAMKQSCQRFVEDSQLFSSSRSKIQSLLETAQRDPLLYSIVLDLHGWPQLKDVHVAELLELNVYLKVSEEARIQPGGLLDIFILRLTSFMAEVNAELLARERKESLFLFSASNVISSLITDSIQQQSWQVLRNYYRNDFLSKGGRASIFKTTRGHP